jgi:isopentenyl-diphosphate delta-isomerase
MKEIIISVDPKTGEEIGSVDKDYAHKHGIWHATIHIWVLDNEGRVLFQERAPDKSTFPGYWDISIGGHIRPNENGLREAEEELGLKIKMKHLEPIAVIPIENSYKMMINREYSRLYLYRSEKTLDSFSFPDGEVSALAAVPVELLPKFFKNGRIKVSVYREGSIREERISGAKLTLNSLRKEYKEILLKYLS